MHRNVTILVIILVIVLIAAYLVWLRGRFQSTEVIPSPAASVEVSAAPSPTLAASPSAVASPSATASASATPKKATPTPKPVR